MRVLVILMIVLCRWIWRFYESMHLIDYFDRYHLWKSRSSLRESCNDYQVKMTQASIIMKQGFTVMKQVASQASQLYGQVVHTMKTNVVLRPMYKWWEGRFWLKEHSCYVNRGRARLYTYLLLFLLIRSRSAKNKAKTAALQAQSKEEIVATALRVSARS
ncbi:ATP synthase subunit [Dirofilaria immitis]